jgi:hypothetical protein
MKFISTRTHGILDYLVGAIMIGGPWLFGFARGGAETWIFVILGLGAVLYSLFTDYEFSLVRAIPMRTHLLLDIMSGVLLFLSPWLFGFHDAVSGPHHFFGIVEILAAICTRATSQVENRPQQV